MNIENDRAMWLMGSGARCSVPPPFQTYPYRLVLLGAPGVGKGTQAELLCQHFGTCHLSTGDVFRAAKKCTGPTPSPAMASALNCMNRGELVSDETVLTLIEERSPCLRCGVGFLLDGFPRTVAQARALETILAAQNVRLDAVLDYRLSLEKIIARLGGRRTCPDCKAVYHIVTLPPKITGACDHCGGVLFQRGDDRPELIRVRMAAYAKNAEPLKRFYRRRKLLIPVAAARTPEEIFVRTLACFKPASAQPS